MFTGFLIAAMPNDPATANGTMDVAIVLGGAVWEGGVPSPSLRRRVLYATELVKSGRARRLILTGGVGRYPPSEAQVMQQLAIRQGVPEEKTILEETATSTFESAARMLSNHEVARLGQCMDRFRPISLIEVSLSVPPTGDNCKGELCLPRG